MYKIQKVFDFSAAHWLEGLPIGHQCGNRYFDKEKKIIRDDRLHGHNYRIEVVLESSTLNEHGFIVDYGELDEFKLFIQDKVEHRCLNNVFPDMQPSAENLSKFFYKWCKNRWQDVVEVRVSETSKTWSSYREDENK